MDEDWPEVVALDGAAVVEPEEDDEESDEVVDFDPDESLPDVPERLSVR